MKRAPALSFLLPLILVLTVPSTSAGSDVLRPVTVQLKWFHQFQFAGFYAAIEQGYYREEGLSVTLIEGTPDTGFTDAVVSGTADFGINITDIIVHRSQGKPVVILAPFFQHSAQRIAVRGDLNIYTPHSLAGRRVMLSGDGEAAIHAMFRAEGVDPGSLDTIQHSWDIFDLINGKTDAMSVYLTSEVYTLQKLGVSFRLINPENYGIDFYGDTLFTSERMIKEHPDVVNGFLDATVRGWKYALAHKEELITLIKESYGYPGERERLRYEAEMISALMAESIVEVGHSNRLRWEKIASTYADLGMLDQPVDLDDLLYDRNILLTELQRRTLITAAVVLAISFVVAIALFLFNIRLQSEVRKQTGELARLNEELGSSLEEKDLLLREIHHRVKNNLQIIGSLINLQHGANPDPEISAIGRKSLQRIQSMALIHEHLYNSDHLDQVDLGTYISELVRLVDQGAHTELRNISLDIRCAPVSASIDIAVPLGLIAVELYTNAVKYSAVPGSEAVIRVRLDIENGICRFSVEDSGPGLRGDAFSRPGGKTLGLTLVSTLARQIGADLTVNSTTGTQVTLAFPLRSDKNLSGH